MDDKGLGQDLEKHLLEKRFFRSMLLHERFMASKDKERKR